MAILSEVRHQAFRVFVGFATIGNRAASPMTYGGGLPQFRAIFKLASRLRLVTTNTCITNLDLVGYRVELKFAIAEELFKAGIRAGKSDISVIVCGRELTKPDEHNSLMALKLVTGFIHEGKTITFEKPFDLRLCFRSNPNANS